MTVRTGLLALSLILAGCTASQSESQSESVEGVSVPDGYSVEVFAEGFDRPTQITESGSGGYLVAQLAGAEGDGTGEVVAFHGEAPADREVLFAGLDKPTGVVVTGDVVWVMQRNSLWKGTISGGDLDVVVDELPFNGRSEGTLTVTPEGEVLFDTSGSLRDGSVVDGSGRLFTISEETPVPSEVASGFKHAYSHVYDAAGTLWATEVSDGSFDGSAAPDELVQVMNGADHGWPVCVGDNRPVVQFGGTEEVCAGVPPSVALFDPGATPTSVAMAPWDPDVMLVALWNRGQVVEIDTTEPWPVEPVVFLTGLDHPQHLLTVGDQLLVVDFDGGRILAIRHDA